MDFTREPIIETVITPREGFKLVVRSSKAVGQEEYFVDAVEVVAFGHALFFRSTEKPKAFLVPTTDYEVLEVREARMVLKHVAIDRNIKIGGGREAGKAAREPQEKETIPRQKAPQEAEAPLATPADAPTANAEEGRYDRKRERRRHLRRRRSRDEREGPAQQSAAEESLDEAGLPTPEEGRVPIVPPADIEASVEEAQVITSSILSSLLPPPPNLIRETIARYKKNEKFRGAFIGDIDEEAEERADEEKAGTEEGEAPVAEEPAGQLPEPVATPPDGAGDDNGATNA